MHPALFILASLCLTPTVLQAEFLEPVPYCIPNAIADKQASQVPDREKLTGMLGVRMENSAINRLLQSVDTDRLLEGYRKRPGRQAWDGEHIGKWLHAATLAWVYTGNPELRAKLDHAVTELIKCQLDDGYLGTYETKERWTSWDVWSHKYNLIGLLTYVRYTGNREPLPACKKMGDLLCRSFGDAPGQTSLLSVGEFDGLPSTSLLEPMVWLYRLTGEKRYRDFCEYILRSWESPKGPRIVSLLLAGKGVNQISNAKAHELLSCINGLLEWARLTGEKNYLQAALNAWQDIVDKRLYITGTCSQGEGFRQDYYLLNYYAVGETCVTVSWVEFNAHLLRLTGEARFADQLERTVYNHLFGAQTPDGRAWGYYVDLKGKKPYSDNISSHCCLSSGPRGLVLLPTFAITTDADGIVVNLYDGASATLTLADGSEVGVDLRSKYPATDSIFITLTPRKPQSFALKLRIPEWCQDATLKVAGKTAPLTRDKDGYVAILRLWQSGDTVTLTLPRRLRIIAGDHINEGLAALGYGPLILAVDAALSDGESNPLLPGLDPGALKFTVEPAKGLYLAWPGAQVFRMEASGKKYGLSPFATAGCDGGRYRTWLRLATSGFPENLLENGKESVSRAGRRGSFLEGMSINSCDGNMADEDWYAVTLDQPATFSTISFVQGEPLHNGGWFDTSGGKPQVQIRTTIDSDWQTVGELTSYAATTSTDSGGIQTGAVYTAIFSPPLTAAAVRVVGKPASGDNPRQAFSSCNGLRALAP